MSEFYENTLFPEKGAFSEWAICMNNRKKYDKPYKEMLRQNKPEIFEARKNLPDHFAEIKENLEALKVKKEENAKIAICNFVAQNGLTEEQTNILFEVAEQLFQNYDSDKNTFSAYYDFEHVFLALPMTIRNEILQGN